MCKICHWLKIDCIIILFYVGLLKLSCFCPPELVKTVCLLMCVVQRIVVFERGTDQHGGK